LSPLFGPLARATSRFSVDRDERSVRVRLGAVPLFEISDELFDGRPKIACGHEQNLLAVEVSGGWLPGTDVPADLQLTARLKGLNWEGRFQLPALAFNCDFPFEPWLLGHPVAHGGVAFGRLLANVPDAAIDPSVKARAVFYPSWTFAIQSRHKAPLATPAGVIHVNHAQVELVGAAESTIGLRVRRAPSTRIWTSGKAAASRSISVPGAAVCFRGQAIDVALELQRNERFERIAGMALESEAPTGAGTVVPGPISAQAVGRMIARRLRVTAVGEQPAHAEAHLINPSCWQVAHGVNLEITAMGGTFVSACQGGAGTFVVTRIVAPMAGVDQAIFVRRGIRSSVGGRSIDASAVVRVESIDNLDWTSAAIGRTPNIPLDDFDLIVSRGADAFQMTTRFRRVALRPDRAHSVLVPQPGEAPLLEFAVGPQHVYEEALYITDLPGATQADIPPYVTDEQICELNNLGTGQACQTALCNARNTGTYATLRTQALAKLGHQISSTPNLRSTRVRFAAPSWFTFEWHVGPRSEAQINLAADDLYDWNRRLSDKRKRYKPRFHSNAKPDTLTLPNQIALRSDKASRPGTLAEGLPQPNVEQVSIVQAPYRLGLSPISEDFEWKVTGGAAAGRPELTELWSMRAESLKVRAVWSPDFQPNNFWANGYTHQNDQPFRSSLDPRDRHELVALTSRFGETALLGSPSVVPRPDAPTEGIFVPQPIAARLLLLSSLGATLRLKGAWAPPAAANSCGGALTIQLWNQNSQFGRDSIVVVEYKGFLCPIGHPATLVKETERRLVYDPIQGIVAKLVQRFYIRVPELARSVPLKQQPFAGRGWPFGNITMHAWVTSDLARPETDDLLGLGQQAFWPREAGGTTSLVDFEYEDTAAGVKARAPLVFLDNAVVHAPDLLHQIVLAYRNGLEATRRGAGVDWKRPDQYASGLVSGSLAVPQQYIARVGNGKVRFAPEDKPGNASYRVIAFLLDIDIPQPGPTQGTTVDASCCAPGPQRTTRSVTSVPLALEEEGVGDIHQALMTSVELEAANQPPIYPHLRQALVEPGVLSQLSNTARQRALVEIDTYYLRSGFDADNPGEIFLRFVDAGAALNFSSDTGNSGGFANATMNMSAVSRKRGPIGGSGTPLPQLPGYRYGMASGGAIAAARTAVPSLDADPVQMARRNAADPAEFFRRSVGSAKLAGVVSFIDICDVVMKVSGAQAPQIVQQLENAVPIDQIHRIASDLESALQSTATQVSLVPRIAAAVANVQSGLQRASQASAADLLALGAPLVAALQQLRDEIRTVIENPATLLPTGALTWLQSLIRLSKSLQDLGSLSDEILHTVGEIVQVGLLSSAETALAADPRLKQLQERIATVRKGIEAIESAKNGDPLELLATLQRELIAVLDGVFDLDTWRIWLQHSQADLNGQIDAYWKRLVNELSAAQNQIVSAAEELRSDVDTLAVKIDTMVAALPANQAELRRAFLEIADISLSAVAHATELQRTISEIGQLQPRDPNQLAGLNRAAQSFRCTVDALAKAPRLASLVATTFPGTHTDADALIASYSQWVTLAGRDLQGKVFQDVRQAITSSLTAGVGAESKHALEWLTAKVDRASAIVNAINGLQVPNDLGPLYEVIDFLVTAPDPRGIALSAINQVKLANQDLILQRLATICGQVADFVATLRTRVAAAQTGSGNSADLRRWLSPSLLARLEHLTTVLTGLSMHPPPDENALRAYLTNVSALSSDFTRLVQEAGHVVATGDVSSLLNVQNVVEKALNQIGAPTGATISYDWITQVHPYPGGSGPVFEPLDGAGTLAIKSRATIDFLKPGPPQMSVEAKLDAFKINLFGAASFLTIIFEPLSFTAGSGQKSHLIANVAGVNFGGQLAFVKTLEQWFRDKFGISVGPWSDGPGIVVGYQFYKPLIGTTAFSLQNVGVGIACILPFNSEPARFRFSLSSPDKPFLLSVGIYGGGGFVGIQSRADTIEFLESSFEYGLVTAFTFGPASGTGRITAGIYIRIGARDAVLSGFFNASGNADIAGLISVCANFRVQIWYETSTGRASGAATFSISFSIGFFDYSFSVGVAYSRQGDSSSSSGASGSRTLVGARTGGSWDRRLSTMSDPLHFGLVETRKQKQAERIPTDQSTGDLSENLLKPDNWARYWEAFEEPLDECA